MQGERKVNVMSCSVPFAECSLLVMQEHLFTCFNQRREKHGTTTNSLSYALREIARKLLPLVLRFVTSNVWSWTKRIACWTWVLNHRFARFTKSCLKQPRPQGLPCHTCRWQGSIRDHLCSFSMATLRVSEETISKKKVTSVCTSIANL